MQVQMKLGNNFFQKEKKITDLESLVIELNDKLAHIQSLNSEYQEQKNKAEKQAFEIRNKYEIQKIEYENFQGQNKRLKEQLQQLKEENENLKNNQKQINKNVQSYQMELDQNQSLIIQNQNLEYKLKQEINFHEKKNIVLVKQIEELKDTIEKKNENIIILEKSLEQKNKHIQILIKEKDRTLTQQEQNIQNKPIKSKQIPTQQFQEPKKNKENENENKNLKIDDQLRIEQNKIQHLQKQLEEKEDQIKKLTQENFEIVTRFKNKK